MKKKQKKFRKPANLQRKRLRINGLGLNLSVKFLKKKKYRSDFGKVSSAAAKSSEKV